MSTTEHNSAFSILHSTFCIVDIETTGLDPTKDEIIEIGAIRYLADGSTTTFQRLIKPKNPVPVFIYQLTKITEDELKKADSAKKVLTEFYAFLSEEDVIVCHNAEFDMRFLQRHISKSLKKDIQNQSLDTLCPCQIFTPFLKSHALDAMAQYFNIEIANAHRAISDAQATGSLLQSIEDFILTYVKPEEINFIVAVLEHATQQSKHSRFLIKREVNDFLLPYLTTLRDEVVKGTFTRAYVTDSPFKPTQTHFLKGNGDGSDARKSIAELFAPSGAFADVFPKYEYRQGQIDMAEAVQTAFENNEFLLVEAGTGVGKSLAYLVPGILFSLKTGNRIVVSTNTKNLQEQLIYKDIPLLAKALDLEFSAVLVKGRENYICRRKWQECIRTFNSGQKNNFNIKESFALLYVYLWATHTETGDKDEITSEAANAIWRHIASDRHICFGNKCEHFQRCFLMNSRIKAEKANIVVINHALLFTAFQNDQSAIGDISYLVMDEAHNLLHSAAEYLGVTLATSDIESFLASISETRGNEKVGMMERLKTATWKSSIKETKKEEITKLIDELITYIDSIKGNMNNPFKCAGDIVRQKGDYAKYRIKEGENYTPWVQPFTEMQAILTRLSIQINAINQSVSLHESKDFFDQKIFLDFMERAVSKINQFNTVCDELIDPDLQKNAFWLNTPQTRAENPDGIFNLATIQVNEQLPNIVYRRLKSLIFTSATMSLRESFKYFGLYMGLDRLKQDNPYGNVPKSIRELVVPSPFNYHTQATVINTAYLPDNKSPNYTIETIELIKDIITQKPVGTLVLFTSYKDLQSAYESLVETCYQKNILLLAQGITGSRSNILNRFKEDGQAVLLGTNSFWEGIDVPGDSLKLLIVYKLPFQVPTDPIVEAYEDKLKSEGKDWFKNYSLPNALLRVRQGIGRLIRTQTDKGVILLLDNRISKMYYGSFFREIIPTQVHSTKSHQETMELVKKGLE